MGSWNEREHYAGQLGGQQHPASVLAPSPASFHETQESSRSYWIKEYRIDLDDSLARAPLPQDVVDVVIIGSGITGATAAYHLSKQTPQSKVALIEARGICTGATGRNGGHICAPEVHGLRSVAEVYGAEEAIRLHTLRTRTRDLMLDAVEELGIAEDIDLRLKGTIVVFASQQEREDVEKDFEYAKQIGFDPECRLLESEQVAKVRSTYRDEASNAQNRQIVPIPESLREFGATLIEKSGTMYPRKFVHKLLVAASERMSNLSIHPWTPAEQISFDETSALYTISTTKGSIRTRSVFHATNGYANRLLPSLRDEKGVFGCKAHMMGVLPNVPESMAQLDQGFGYEGFWHWLLQRPNHGPFLYGAGDAELINDYDDTVTLPKDHSIRGVMLKFLEKAFPTTFANIDEATGIQYDWTGVQGFTMNNMSVVGRPDSNSPGEFASVAHNGQGMIRCFSSATIAIDALLAYLNNDRKWSPPEWFPVSFRRNM